MILYSATRRASSTSVTYHFSFLFYIAKRCELCSVGVVRGDKEDTVIWSPKRDQAMLESKQRQIMQPMIAEGAAK